MSEDELVNTISSLESRIVEKLNEKLANKPEGAKYGGIFTYVFIGNFGHALLLDNKGRYSFKFDMTGVDMGELTVDELMENYAEVCRSDFPERTFSDIPRDVDDETFSRLLEEKDERHKVEVENYLLKNKIDLLKEMITKMEKCLSQYE